MRKIIWPLAGIISVASVSAQQMQDFTLPIGNLIESLGPTMNSLANALFSTNISGSGWLNVLAFWILISVLVHSFLARFSFFNNSKASSITLSVIAGYFLLNNSTSMSLVSNISDIGSLFIIFFSIGVLYWLIPKITMGEHTLVNLADKSEKYEKKKEKKTLDWDKKIGQMEIMLEEHDKKIQEHEKTEISEEEAKNEEVINDLNKILNALEQEKDFENQIKSMEKKALSSQEVQRIQNLQRNYADFKIKVEKLIKKFKTDEAEEQQIQTMEEGETEEEKSDVKTEKKDDKEEIKNIEKSVKKSEKVLKNKHLPMEDREAELSEESEKNIELSVDKRKNQLIKQKLSLVNKKNSYRGHISKINKKMNKMGNGGINEISKIKELHAKEEMYIRTIKNIDKELDRIIPELEKIEKEEEQIEQKEESDLSKAA